MKRNRPWVCISDLHAGCGDARDNHAGRGAKAVEGILDFASDIDANVVVVGDLLELWQNNVSECIQHNLPLLDRLAAMKAVYVLGNHEDDFFFWIGTNFLNHNLFRRMVPKLHVSIGGRRFLFIHGHQADPECDNPRPGRGRMSAIWTGLWEDRHGSPQIGKCSVEDVVLGPMSRVASLAGRLIGLPSRRVQLHRGLRPFLSDADAIVFGHTHEAGELHNEDGSTWAYNCGCPNNEVPSFVWIEPTGEAAVYDWFCGKPVLNSRVLPW